MRHFMHSKWFRFPVLGVFAVLLAGCWSLNTTDSSTDYVTQSLTSSDGNHYLAQNLVFGESSTCTPYQTLSTSGTDPGMGDSNISFKVLSSQLAAPTCQTNNPMAFPNIARGVKLSTVTAGTIDNGGQVKLTWTGDTSGVASADKWDFIADIWFSPSTTTTCPSGCKELELWMTSAHVGPAGTFQGTGTYGGISMDVYTGSAPDATYKFHTARESLSSYDINAIVADAEFRGIVPSTWVLNNISTGFELWDGGSGLQYQDLAVCVIGHGC